MALASALPFLPALRVLEAQECGLGFAEVRDLGATLRVSPIIMQASGGPVCQLCTSCGRLVYCHVVQNN